MRPLHSGGEPQRGAPTRAAHTRHLRMGLIVLAVASAIALFALGLHLPERGVATSSPAASSRPMATVNTAATATFAVAIDAARVPAEPERILRAGSLRDTEVDGALQVDRNDELVVDIALRRLFDYYLASIGELDADAIRGVMAQRFSARYPLGLVHQALVVFDRYRDYQIALLQEQPQADLHVRLARLHALRIAMLGRATATAFFADDEDHARFTLAQQDLQRDVSLSPTARQARSAELLAALPEAERAERSIAQSSDILAAQEAALDHDQSDNATRHAQRAANWGEQAAQNLDALDQQRADWQARLLAYAEQRAAILADPALAASQREQALGDLLATRFADAERLRVLSLQQENLLPAIAR